MRDVYIAILAYYNGDATLPNLAPLRRATAGEVSLPYVVLHLISGKPVFNSGCYDVSEKPLMQFSIWAETEDSADEIFEALKDRFDNAELSYPGSYCIREGNPGGVDEAGVWYYHVDYLIDNQL